MEADKTDNFVGSEGENTSCWANMPPELLRDILSRIELSEDQWPARRNVVACAAVCSLWREVTREIVKTPEAAGSLTFPISLKQPGPRDAAIQCFIKRDRTTSTYQLFLGLPPSPVENGKFLLAARKCRRATSTDYIISLVMDDMSRASNNYVGKLRSNFLGTKFNIFDSQASYSCVTSSSSSSPKGSSRRVAPKQMVSKVPGGSYHVAAIAYELNVLGTRGPRRMQCTLNSIPASALEPGGSVPTPTQFCTTSEASLLAIEHEALGRSYSSGLGSPPKERKAAAVADCSTVEWESTLESAGLSCKDPRDGPLVLKNKAPRWHEQLQCWCLNFRGRVTVASVKNFQLVAAAEQLQACAPSEQDKVLLQFGKIGKDMFTMDYRYPLSAFQAFAICLSSFDTKLACE